MRLGSASLNALSSLQHVTTSNLLTYTDGSSSKDTGAAASTQPGSCTPFCPQSAEAAIPACMTGEPASGNPSTSADRLAFLESMFQTQNDRSTVELQKLHASLQTLANKMDSELTLQALRYMLVDGRLAEDPKKVHQLRSACNLAPTWAWRTRCGLQVSSTRTTASVCSEATALAEPRTDPCKICRPDCMYA